MTEKELYESIGTVADMLPDDETRSLFADLMEELTFTSRWERSQHTVNRWLREAGYGRRA